MQVACPVVAGEHTERAMHDPFRLGDGCDGDPVRTHTIRYEDGGPHGGFRFIIKKQGRRCRVSNLEVGLKKIIDFDMV